LDDNKLQKGKSALLLGALTPNKIMKITKDIT